jgi:hypothetical protein
MTSQLRPDEEFVIRAITAHFGGAWSPGQNPPDAYLAVDQETVAVEISTLTQHVTDERGGTKSRLSEDMTALRLAEELNEELREAIPSGLVVVLTMRAPILEARRTKEELRKRIMMHVTNNAGREIDLDETILGNRIGITLGSHDGPDKKKVVAAVDNRKSDPHIASNARHILEERIATKTKKCSALALNGPVWLALLNDYFLASVETYRQAFAQIQHPHIFDKILLISGDGSVTTLYDKSVCE